MGHSTLLSSKISLTLDLPPSCVQFCPAHPHHFVVGTYNLEKDDEVRLDEERQEDSSAGRKAQSRNGSLVVFKIEGEDL